MIHSIQSLTKRFGLTARTLRFWSEKELLFPKMTGGGRQFHESDVQRIHLIIKGQLLGLELEAIRQAINPEDLTKLHLTDEQLLKLHVAATARREHADRQLDAIADLIAEGAR